MSLVHDLLAGGGDEGRREDAGAEVMTAGEDAEVAGHVEAGRRDEGAQARQEFLGGHVGVGGPAAPRGLEVDAHAAVGENLHGVVGERRALAMDAAQAKLAFQVISERYDHRRSTMITTNRLFKDWTKVFPDPLNAQVIAERLTERAEVFLMNGKGYRDPKIG